ncbi:hypothetical protein P7C70_g1711, partial [Phenoliferia sp. Uapishka_3]
MSLETSFSLFSLDPAGYPIGIGLNALHLLTRLSVFATAIPEWWSSVGSGSGSGTGLFMQGGRARSARELADADARLEALKRQALRQGGKWGIRITTTISILLVLISFANAAYLLTRRRRYHLVLRQDPVSSPNARSAMLNFSPPKASLSLIQTLKKKASNLLGFGKEEEQHQYKIQQLDIWTPDYVKWSLRVFRNLCDAFQCLIPPESEKLNRMRHARPSCPPEANRAASSDLSSRLQSRHSMSVASSIVNLEREGLRLLAQDGAMRQIAAGAWQEHAKDINANVELSSRPLPDRRSYSSGTYLAASSTNATSAFGNHPLLAATWPDVCQNIVADFESAPVDYRGLPAIKNGDLIEKKALGDSVEVNTTFVTNGGDGEQEGRAPTEEEKLTLRLVPAAMPWAAGTFFFHSADFESLMFGHASVMMCLIEFAERASYYGSSGNTFTRAVMRIHKADAPGTTKGSSPISSSNGDFHSEPASGWWKRGWCGVRFGEVPRDRFADYSVDTRAKDCIPIAGGIIADTKWGRFKTIAVGAIIGFVSHVLLGIPAIPSVIKSGNALGPFVLAMIILAFASGFIKPCLSPLLRDQSPVKKQTVITLKSGENVILDPATTISRYLLIFYFAINIGAFFRLGNMRFRFTTTYAEHDIGYWLAFLLPGIIYMIMPLILVFLYKRLYKAPPRELSTNSHLAGGSSEVFLPERSVLVECASVVRRLLKDGGWKRCWKGGDSFWDVEAREGPLDVSKVFWDDQFVDELRQSFSACKVFLLIPIFALSDGGIGNSENAMSTAMVTNGVPNDLIGNFNSLTIVVLAPLMNYLWYPWMRKMGYSLKPMTRMAVGFILGGINMIIGAILQWRAYKTLPCGHFATSDCAAGVSSVSLWAQIPLYSLPAIGEIDPYLIWPYVGLACACFIAAAIFPTVFKDLNEPIEFGDVARMEGKLQPKALLEGSGNESAEKKAEQA